MKSISKLISGTLEFNKGTFTGAQDVIVVEKPDGQRSSTPFHIEFSKYCLMRCKNQPVSIEINGEPIQVRMLLNSEGRAYFAKEIQLSPLHMASEQIGVSSPVISQIRSKSQFRRKTVQGLSFEESKTPPFPGLDSILAGLPDIFERTNTQFSLCGKSCPNTFEDFLLDFESINSQPSILNDPNLRVKINEEYYLWNEAKIILSKWIEEYKFSQRTCLSSEELQEFPLEPGPNKITYTIHSKYQGSHSIESRIFLWESSSKIVVSDIDGTITKSNVLGIILPLFGKDWTQPGIASLYNTIVSQGYKILYLSSRSTAVRKKTRGLLENISQNGVKLPDGPLMLFTNGFMQSLVREVVIKNPEKNKAIVLLSLAKHFDENPLAGGFGNQKHDAIAYRAANIASNRIFIVNSSCEIQVFNSANKTKNYTALEENIERLFPKI